MIPAYFQLATYFYLIAQKRWRILLQPCLSLARTLLRFNGAWLVMPLLLLWNFKRLAEIFLVGVSAV